MAALKQSGVNVIVLLALSDDGHPGYHAYHAEQIAAMDCLVFACSPDQFPELMAAALTVRIYLSGLQRGTPRCFAERQSTDPRSRRRPSITYFRTVELSNKLLSSTIFNKRCIQANVVKVIN